MQIDRLPKPAIDWRRLITEDDVQYLERCQPFLRIPEDDHPTQWVDIDISQLEYPEEEIGEVLALLLGIVPPYIPDAQPNFSSGSFGEVDDFEEAVRDLLDSDDWPEMGAIGPFRKLSLTCLVPIDPDEEPRRNEHNDNPAPPELYGSRVEVLLTKEWVISAWHPIRRITQTSAPEANLSSTMMRLRESMEQVVTDTIDTDQLTTGGDFGIALIRGSLATFSGHRRDLHKRLDDWEHRYYEKNFGAGSETTGGATAKETRNSTKTLAEIHAAGVDLSRELDHLTAPRDRAALHWVGKNTTSDAGTHAAEIYDQKIDRYRISLRDIRDRVRAGLDLSHSVESTKRDEAARKRDSFIAKIAAVFLAPTLVAGFYGINTHYPDAGTTRGTVEAIILMILSAAGAWGGIVWFEKRDRKDEDS